jgi:hypothetical protein
MIHSHLRTASAVLLLSLLVILVPSGVAAQARSNIFFLHHSTGHNLIDQGQMRTYFNTYNAAHGTQLAFWDHDYNPEGLRNPAGAYVGHSYGIPNDNTDPDGLYYLWTVPNAARDSIMANHAVIAFKSCYPASAIGSAAQLAQYQSWYLAMRSFFDLHPERTFVVMSPPPLHRLATNAADAARARSFAVWLKSGAYLSGHPNVFCFDLFDQFAQPADGSAAQNMLRYEYELSHGSNDSHPNLLANQTVGPIFVQFLATVAEGAPAGTDEAPIRSTADDLFCFPNPILAGATLRYQTAAPGWTNLTIYDSAGRRQAVLANRYEPAGTNVVLWDAGAGKAAVRPGVYWARLERDGGVVARQKLVVLR